MNAGILTKEAIEAARQIVEPNVVMGDIDDDTATFSTGGLIGDIAAALSTLPIAGEVPEGWALVPVKPTMEMVKNAAGDHEGENWLPHSLWASMLAAAPVPPSSPGKDGGQEVEAVAGPIKGIGFDSNGGGFASISIGDREFSADEVRRALYTQPASTALVERLEDKIDGLQADLDSAVEVAYHRGATEWTRLNYPDHFKRLSASTSREGER